MHPFRHYNPLRHAHAFGLHFTVPQRRRRRLEGALGTSILDLQRGADVASTAWSTSDGSRGALARQDCERVATLVGVGVVFAHLDLCLLLLVGMQAVRLSAVVWSVHD